MDSSWIIKSMAKEKKYIRLEGKESISESFMMDCEMVGELLNFKIIIFMKENLRMI